jgi:excinuclease ABC subunit C
MPIEPEPQRVLLLQQVKNLPENPGVYQYFDSSQKIIYVGKAKNLKKRVQSYFRADANHYGKTKVLVKNIATMQYIVVNTELDALLLENTLIKEHQPRYNILLKDDKTYPWICIKKEPFPRVFTTRKVIQDGSFYFGPYPSGRMMGTILTLVKQLFKIRNCSLPLTPNNIAKKKFRVCLEFHIGNCKGPCEDLQKEDDYNLQITEIKSILKGQVQQVVKRLKESMQEAAANYNFEEAQFLKMKLEALENYQSRSIVVSPVIDDVDVIALLNDEDSAYANFMRVVKGAVIQSFTIEMKKRLDETESELLGNAYADFLNRFGQGSKEIILPFEPDFELPGFQITIPQRGDKKKLIELAYHNAEAFKREKIKQANLVDPERHTNRVLEKMMKDFRMKELPRHIECFDNSNIQGNFAVAAMTVFKNLKPSKKDYRHFNIKTVEGPDDFASMEEVVFRRYKRAVDENETLPQLIVIDGGKGQLSSAVYSLQQLGLMGKVTIVGIAKKLEEIYFPGDSVPLYIDKKSESLKIIQQIRDEAHRFGITHHRNKRSKGTIKTGLTEIPGIGETLSTELLRVFKSVKKIKEAGEEDLAAVVGVAKAKVVIDYFKGA